MTRTSYYTGPFGLTFFTIFPQSLEYYFLASLRHSVYYDLSYSEFPVTFETPLVRENFNIEETGN